MNKRGETNYHDKNAIVAFWHILADQFAFSQNQGVAGNRGEACLFSDASVIIGVCSIKGADRESGNESNSET